MTKLLTERKIENCEMLHDNKHPNIAQYRGVVRKDYVEFGKGTSLSFRMKLDTEHEYKLEFKRYDCDFWSLVRSGKRLDVKYCLKSIEAGLFDMHSLGLCHDDIKPTNVFAETLCIKQQSRQHESVIGDFDSTAPTGSKFTLKAGTQHWRRSTRQGDMIKEDNDWCAFQNLFIWLVKETRGRLDDYSGVGKRVAGANGPPFERSKLSLRCSLCGQSWIRKQRD
jgi:serine/threonine protein kinase